MNNFTFRRSVFLFVSFFFLTYSLKSQQTLTQINGWNAYVHLPANYTTTTNNYPTIIFFPGLGEVGTNASAVIANGPGAYLTQGWNGNVLVDGNTVEFIIISLQPPAAYPAEVFINDKIQLIKSLYRVDPNRLYLTGLSHGGWCSTTFVTGDAYGGPYTYASQIAAVVEVEGVKPDDNSPYPNLFDNFALSGGKLLGFEQVLDGRDIQTRVNRMNATIANSAIYVQTNFGGGGHCCWNQFYGGQGTQPGNFFLGGVTQNLYQWLARQSRGGPVNQPPVANAGTGQTITLPTNSVTLTGTATDADGTIASTLWTKLSGPAGAIITNPGLLSTTVTGLVQGNYVFQLTATDNLGATGSSSVSVTVNVAAGAPVCNTNAPASYIVSPTGPNEIYITNASARGWKGGDTLRILAGTYSVIEIDSFGGDPCRDIVIMNSGGLVNVNGPMRFKNDVHHVKITGSGFPGLTYGFKAISFAFSRVNHYTMERVEVGPNPGGVGIYGKQDPYVGQPWTQYPNYTSTKITINNCYVHDVAGEGMYIGHTYPDGDPANSNLVPQRQDSVTISNCTVTNTGWDGIQLSNARNGCLIFGNTVTNFGLTDIDGQRAGIISGGNTSSKVYSNTVTNGKGNGLEFFGYGVLECYNNTITNVGNTIRNINGEESIYGQAYFNLVETNPRQAMVIHDNQINYPKPLGAIRFNDNANSDPVNLYNNKFCFAVTPPGNWQSLYIFLQAGYINTNNILSCNITNQPPTANAGPDIILTLPANTASLAGSGTDPDGNIASYGWIKIAGPVAGTLTNANSATATASGLAAGVYKYELTVTDNGGATAKDTMQVTVNVAPNQPPTANAGPDIILTLPANTTSLAGSGTDPDGNIASYGWIKIAGPVAGTLTNANSATATASGLAAGVYKYELTVTDNGGATAKDTMQVTVNVAPNQPPTANAGPDIILTLPANTTSLAGSGTDPDGNIASYGWIKIAGPVAGTLTNANSATATASGLAAGVYKYELTVTDNGGATAKDTMQVTVNVAPNQPPTANAGPDIILTLPANTASLAGSGTDPDGNIASYGWIKIAGPVAGTLTNANSATATAGGLAAGVYKYELTVTDNGGATAKDTMQVTVNVAPNQPPTANAGPDIILTLPANTTSLAGSGTDPDGNIASYGWIKIAGPVAGTLTNANSATATAGGLAAGVYKYELTVTDNGGATAKDTMQVTVNVAPNQPPTANAGPDIILTLPANTTSLAGSGTDPDGNIASYGWIKIAGPVAGTLTNANSATATASGLAAGVYKYELTVTDNGGATAKDTMQVTVNVAPNQPPTANAGPDIIITLPANTASLAGSGTDPDGNISSYGWIKIAGPVAGTLTNANSATATAGGLAAGVYKYELTVTDNGGATAKDTMQVTVNVAGNQPPSANAGADITIILPTNSATLTGSATDPDGSITAYRWVKIAGPSAGILTSTNSGTTSTKFLVEGVYEFELTVSDNAGATAKDTIAVAVIKDPQQDQAEEVKIYPNPVQGILHITVVGPMPNETVSLMLVNGQGIVLRQYPKVQLIGNKLVKDIDMSQFRPGTYYLKVTYSNNSKLVSKIIKM